MEGKIWSIETPAQSFKQLLGTVLQVLVLWIHVPPTRLSLNEYLLISKSF